MEAENKYKYQNTSQKMMFYFDKEIILVKKKVTAIYRLEVDYESFLCSNDKDVLSGENELKKNIDKKQQRKPYKNEIIRNKKFQCRK